MVRCSERPLPWYGARGRERARDAGERMLGSTTQSTPKKLSGSRGYGGFWWYLCSFEPGVNYHGL